MSQLITHLETLLNEPANKLEPFKQAFYHTSYVNEKLEKDIESNERLEFLGDAVLELVVSNYLYEEYPNEPEGVLTRLRAQLVREETLSILAKRLKFNDYIMLGRGERANGGSKRDSILSDCFEAFLGALYLEYGLKSVEAFLYKIMLKDHKTLLKAIDKDFKTRFQELIQKHGTVAIDYRLIKQSGPSHDQEFTMGLYVNNTKVAQGVGKSKKQAEMKAAEAACEKVDEEGNLINVSS